ncbi:MAG: hypothetical protein PUE15_10835 [Prevotella sp.]|nr:hypothetical protein [Prevotella sp.]
MDYRPTRYGLEKSDAIEEIDRIIEAGRQQRQENREKKESREAAVSAANAPSSDAPYTDNPAASATTETKAPTNVANQPEATSFSNDIAVNVRKPKGRKTENGITIYVPMEYYEQIALMKMRTGVPIKDLALQAVIEFLDRNK